MSFEFTVLPDERFVEILDAWVDSPWPKTIETGYQLRDHFGWIPKVEKPHIFTSDVRPDEFSSFFGRSNGYVRSFDFPITNIAPEEAWGYSLNEAKRIYRHFCELLMHRYGKHKQRRAEQDHYMSTFATSQGAGIKLSGNDALLSCIVESPEEMFIASEYARLVAKGYISVDE